MNHLPWALKVAWFVLSLTGLVQSIVTLVWIGRDMLTRWVRYAYLLGVVILEVMFCLGMIWHMDPTRMPRPFCIAQVLGFGLGSYILTGVIASFALASSLAVLKPTKHKAYTTSSVLAWHPRYFPLVILFPVVALAAQTTLTFIFNDVQPGIVDDLHCDATDPLWMRLVGYAGPPQLVTIPFLVLSIYTALRLHRFHSRVVSSKSPSFPSVGLNSHGLTTPNMDRRRSGYGIGFARAGAAGFAPATRQDGEDDSEIPNGAKRRSKRFSMWMAYPYSGYRANGDRRSPLARLRATRAAEVGAGMGVGVGGDEDEKAIDLADLSPIAQSSRSRKKHPYAAAQSDTTSDRDHAMHDRYAYTEADADAEDFDDRNTLTKDGPREQNYRLAHSRSDLSMSGALRAPSEAPSSLMPTFAQNPSLLALGDSTSPAAPSSWQHPASFDLAHGSGRESVEGSVEGGWLEPMYRGSPVTDLRASIEGRGTPVGTERESRLSFVGPSAYALTTDEPDRRPESVARATPSPLGQAVAITSPTPDMGDGDEDEWTVVPQATAVPLAPHLSPSSEQYDPTSPHSARSPILAGSYFPRFGPGRYGFGFGPRRPTIGSTPQSPSAETSTNASGLSGATFPTPAMPGPLFRIEPHGRLAQSPELEEEPESEYDAEAMTSFSDATRHRRLTSVDGAHAFADPHPGESEEFGEDVERNGKGGANHAYSDAEADDFSFSPSRTGVPRRTVEPRDPMAREKMVYPTGMPLALSMGMRDVGDGSGDGSGGMGAKQVLAKQLRGALWRMVLFQIVFFVVQLLAGLSPLIDVIRGRPSSFGTQHVALILAAWGPFLIFGHTGAAKDGFRRLGLNWLNL